MCELCRRHPCDSRCPNAPEPEIFDHCVACGSPIFDGDDYYEIDGEPRCEFCVENARKTANVEE